jgi:hypothetical protein
MSGQGIDVGDAVLTFLGDTTRLDGAFASLPGKAAAAGDAIKDGFSGFDDVIDDSAGGIEGLGKQAVVAGEVTKVSMREARGETALLGEEFGIRLPRHVRSFIAELPGVGEAMSAAFSATAILFIVQAIAQATEKLANFVGQTFIYTSAMKQANAELISNNLEIAKQAAAYDTAKEALDSFGETGLEKAKQKLEDLTRNLNDNSAEIKKWHDIVLAGARATGEAYDSEGQAVAYVTEEDKKNLSVAEQKYSLLMATNKATTEQIELQKKLVQQEQQASDKKEHDEAVKAYYEKVELKEKEAALFKQLDEQELESERKKYYEGVDLAEKAAAANAKTDKEYHDAVVKQYYETKELEEKDLEIKKQVLKQDEEATQKQIEYAKAHHKTTVELEKELQLLQRLEREIGVTPAVIDKAKTAMDELSETTHRAGEQMLDAFGSALTGALRDQESFGHAMEKAVFGMLGSLCRQWAQYYFALAIPNLMTPGMEATGEAELAGAIALEALGGALGAAGGGSGGRSGPAGNPSGGASGGNNYAYGSSVSNTGSLASSGRSNVSVQAFADGGLVTGPTLALIGENATPDNPEVVIPPAGTGSGGGAGMRGDVHFHVNVKGLISDGDLSKVMKKMSDRVARGRGTLNSSSTFQVTRRGA